MIRALAHEGGEDGKPVVLLGLDQHNLTRLTSDRPIRVNLQNLGPGQKTHLPDIDVVIFFDDGKTSEQIRKRLAAQR